MMIARPALLAAAFVLLAACGSDGDVGTTSTPATTPAPLGRRHGSAGEHGRAARAHRVPVAVAHGDALRHRCR